MKRRIAIRYMFMIAGSVILIPSCTTHSGKASIVLHKVDITADEEQFLAALAEMIIPRTDTPGAADLGCHLFVLKMLDDCYEEEVQQKFVLGLRELSSDIAKRFTHSFTQCSQEQKQQVIADLESKKQYSAEVLGFYTLMKDRLIEGYLTSKYVLIDIQHYQLIPAVAYDGYYPVNHT
ncbi:MAG: gluconate 2-dehydrogenase subunit 3 family protein [Chitinophagaceae bacterium]|nr:gluconate 2-dehydrogenase subunit 3 family protein [Chitinophagaceae bacterium]